MGLAEAYIEKFKTPCIYATITRNTGKPGVDAIGTNYTSPSGFQLIDCNMSFGFNQSSATCTLTIDTDVAFRPMDRVVVYQGWNDYYQCTFFGFVDAVTYKDFPRIQTLECRDILKLAMNNYYIHYNRKIYYKEALDGTGGKPDERDPLGNPLGGQSESERYAENIISQLLVDSGIPTSHQAFFLNGECVDIDGYRIVVGNHEYWEVVNMSAMDAINALCELVGFKLWATPDGMVNLKMMRAVASSNYSEAYSRAVDIFDDNQSFNPSIIGSILDITADTSDESLRNWVDIKGYTISGITQVTYNTYLSSDYVSDPPTYRRCEIQSDLIDTESVAKAIGDQVLEDLNRLNYLAKVTIIGDPRVQIGQTIGIYDPFTVGASIMNYFLSEYSSDFSSRGYTTSLGLTGGIGTGSTPVTTNVPPIAIWKYDTTASSIICDGTSSYDPDGAKSSLKFVWTCSGYATVSGAGSAYWTRTYPVTGSGILIVTLGLIDSGTPVNSSSAIKYITYSGMI